ncbi:MAG: VOC family protein [Leptolyngbyaceae cyanobacterium SM1_1_3]|nr:VOC family protein [Leptolyngbyaceae cyanobacterium SM1_1_3]NJN03821.1 VOC family protein [Leptolyngbyaceae cyanobacterium RM1_1_2]
MTLSTQPLVQRTGAIALTVSDLDRILQFYVQALGFEFVSDLALTDVGKAPTDKTPVRVVTLRLGQESIALMHYPDAESKPIPADSQSNDLWFQHFAVVVSDIDAAYRHLKTFDIEPISTQPQTFPPANAASAQIQAFKFTDPDSHNLEIIQFPPDKGEAKWQQKTDRLFLGIDHSALAVATTAESLAFYRDLLGLQVAGSSFNWREVQSRLDDLPKATVNVTTLQAANGGIGIELLDYLRPTPSRPFPADWTRRDIAHMHIELTVADLEQAIAQLKTRGVSYTALSLLHPDASPYRQGVLIKDPNGHALLLLANRLISGTSTSLI